MSDITGECVNEIKEFVDTVKKQMYLDKQNTSDQIVLYLESSDIYGNVVITNSYGFGRIGNNAQMKDLLKCPIRGENTTTQQKVIKELKNIYDIDEKYHKYKYVNNDFDFKCNGKWYYHLIKPRLSFMEKFKFTFNI